MNNRSKEFMIKLFDLMEEYNVTISVEELTHRWESEVIGIDFDFAPIDGIQSPDYVSVPEGRYIHNSDIKRAIVKKWGMM